MKMKKISTLLMVPALAVSLAACGGSSKPSKADVEASLTELFSTGAEQLPDEQKEQMSTMASCTAEKIHETMSAEGLQRIADGDFENQPEDAMTEEDQKALENAMMACLEEAFPELSTGE